MIFLIQGPPGAGKSTISKRLQRNFGIPHISKDDITETIYDETQSLDDSRSNQLILDLVEDNKDLAPFMIIETNFNQLEDKKRLSQLIEEFNLKVVEIFLSASDEILLKRFKERWESGQRHKCHKDNEKIEALKKYLKTNLKPISCGEKIYRVDSSGDQDEVYQSVASIFKEYIQKEV